MVYTQIKRVQMTHSARKQWNTDEPPSDEKPGDFYCIHVMLYNVISGVIQNVLWGDIK